MEAHLARTHYTDGVAISGRRTRQSRGNRSPSVCERSSRPMEPATWCWISLSRSRWCGKLPLRKSNSSLALTGVRVLVTASVTDLGGHQIDHPFFLDTGPFDGRQSRLRRQIDQLKAKVFHLETQRDRFLVGNTKRRPLEEVLPVLRQEISRC